MRVLSVVVCACARGFCLWLSASVVMCVCVSVSVCVVPLLDGRVGTLRHKHVTGRTSLMHTSDAPDVIYNIPERYIRLHALAFCVRLCLYACVEGRRYAGVYERI